MEDENMLPLKRVELSLSKFNEVAIPHHLDLLRQHRANIIKYESGGEYGRVRVEQAAAARAASRLRALLAELDALRRRVRPDHRAAFDQHTQRARDLTLQAIMDYLECPAGRAAGGAAGGAAVCGSAVSTESVGVVRADPELLQLQIDEQEAALRGREAALRGWAELQAEVAALHETWRLLAAAAGEQRETVTAAAAAVDAAAEDVSAARTHLALSERMRAGALGAGGALAGALCGGPVGLLLGAKAGAAAVLAGSALGYLGARLVGRRRQLQLTPAPPEPDEPLKDR